MKWFVYVVCLVLLSSLALAVNTDTQLFQFAKNESGSEQLIGDFSGTAQEFIITPPEGETWIISRVLIEIEQSGSWATDKYGALTALTNGIRLYKNQSGVVTNLTEYPVKTNANWGIYTYDVTYHEFGGGSADDTLNVRWTFSRGGAYIKLEHGDKIAVVINDDTTGLIDHTFLFHGYIQETNEQMSNAPIIAGLLLTALVVGGFTLFMKKDAGLAEKVTGGLLSIAGFILGFRFTALHYEGASTDAIAHSLNTWYSISMTLFMFAIAISTIFLLLFIFSRLFDDRGRAARLRDENEPY